MPSLNALRAFEAVARHSSYQRAAEELGVTAAAVKQLVAKLEDTLDRKLVERDGRGVSLTQAGRLGAGDLTNAMGLMVEATSKMRASQEGKRLIVSVEASLATTWLVPRLEDFRSQFPHINVLIDSSQRIVDLNRSEVDIAIRYGVAPDKGLMTHRLFDDYVSPACSPSLVIGNAPLSEIAHLTKVPLIHWDMSQLPWAEATRRWFDWEEWIKKAGVTGIDVSKGARFSDYGLAVQAAISGQGVLLASRPILQDPIDAGLLVHPFPDSALATDIGYDMVMLPSSVARFEVSAFSKWLLDMAGTQPGA